MVFDPASCPVGGIVLIPCIQKAWISDPAPVIYTEDIYHKR